MNDDNDFQTSQMNEEPYTTIFDQDEDVVFLKFISGAYPSPLRMMLIKTKRYRPIFKLVIGTYYSVSDIYKAITQSKLFKFTDSHVILIDVYEQDHPALTSWQNADYFESRSFTRNLYPIVEDYSAQEEWDEEYGHWDDEEALKLGVDFETLKSIGEIPDRPNEPDYKYYVDLENVMSISSHDVANSFANADVEIIYNKDDIDYITNYIRKTMSSKFLDSKDLPNEISFLKCYE